MKVKDLDDYIRGVLATLLWDYLEIVHLYCVEYKLEYLKHISRKYVEVRRDYERTKQYHLDRDKEKHYRQGANAFNSLFAIKHNEDIFRKIIDTYIKVYDDEEYAKYNVLPQVHAEATLGFFYACLAVTTETRKRKVNKIWLDFFSETKKILDAFVWQVAPEEHVIQATVKYLSKDLTEFKRYVKDNL